MAGFGSTPGSAEGIGVEAEAGIEIGIEVGTRTRVG